MTGFLKQEFGWLSTTLRHNWYVHECVCVYMWPWFHFQCPKSHGLVLGHHQMPMLRLPPTPAWEVCYDTSPILTALPFALQDACIHYIVIQMTPRACPIIKNNQPNNTKSVSFFDVFPSLSLVCTFSTGSSCEKGQRDRCMAWNHGIVQQIPLFWAGMAGFPDISQTTMKRMPKECQ